MEINWNYPEPRPGIKGIFDRFFGPGMTRLEIFINFAGLIILSCLIILPVYLQGIDWSSLQWIIFILITIDICGGLLTLAFSPAKRWEHREGKGFVSHFSFVAVHVHPVIIGLLFAHALVWGVSVYLAVVCAAAIVLIMPLYLQRPVAAFFIAFSVVMAGLIPAPTGFFWFAPLFFLKLIGGHCTREEPYRP